MKYIILESELWDCSVVSLDAPIVAFSIDAVSSSCSPSRSHLARGLLANQMQAARKSLATRLQLASQSNFRGSEMLPQRHNIDPRGVKNRTKIVQGAPRSAQECPRAPQERPRAAEEHPKSTPRASQERPRAPQERPKAPQEPLKSVWTRPRQASGHHFEASELEKSDLQRRSVTRLGREARS